MKASILVRAEWDPEAGVWVATSDDVPGLVTEAETPDELQRKLLVMIPELLELNDDLIHEFPPEVPVFIPSQQLTKVRLRT
jgi:predicted RNase H-like HicB family nuclease